MEAPASRQSGFTLIEAMIVLGVSVSVMLALARGLKEWADVQKSQYDGAMLAQYNNAVASYVTNEPVRLQQMAPPQAMPFGNYAGFGWLQDAATCPGGTGGAAYLPCTFPGPWNNTFGFQFNTVVAQQPGGFITATTTFGPARRGNVPDNVMSGKVARAAESYVGGHTANLERTSGMTSWRIDLPAGDVVGVVDTALLGQPFLRTDGLNSMGGPINMNGNNIDNAGAVNAQSVGANNMSTTNLTAFGTARVQDIQAQSATVAGNLSARNVTASNNVNAGGDVRLMGDSGYINPDTGASTPISLARAVWGQTYVDNGNNIVYKPRCPAGLTPQLYMVPGQWSAGGKAEPVGAMDLTYTDHFDRWEVAIILTTPSHPGGYMPPAGTATALVNYSCQ